MESFNLTNTSDTSVTELVCYGATKEEMKLYANLTYWIELVVHTIIGVLGILANIVTIPILCSKALDNIFNRILVFLTVFDSLFILLSLMESARRHYPTDSAIYSYLLCYLLYPLQNIVLCAIVYLPVALALERYRAIKHPVEYYNANVMANTWKKAFVGYVLPSMSLSIVICLPKFFEIKVAHGQTIRTTFNPEDNTTSDEAIDIVGITFTDLRFNEHYVLWYINVLKLLNTGLMPFVALVYLNIKIYRVIARRNANRLGGNRPINRHNAEVKEAAAKRSRVLFVICGIFLLSHSLRVTLGVHELAVLKHYQEALKSGCNAVKFWILVAATVSQLLLTFNSSINFAVYCLMSVEFRTELQSEWVKLKNRCFDNRQNGTAPPTVTSNSGHQLNLADAADSPSPNPSTMHLARTYLVEEGSSPKYDDDV